jgi:hypothetical protein
MTLLLTMSKLRSRRRMQIATDYSAAEAMFESTQDFNEEPKYMSPGPKLRDSIGCSSTAVDARMGLEQLLPRQIVAIWLCSWMKLCMLRALSL